MVYEGLRRRGSSEKVCQAEKEGGERGLSGVSPKGFQLQSVSVWKLGSCLLPAVESSWRAEQFLCSSLCGASMISMRKHIHYPHSEKKTPTCYSIHVACHSSIPMSSSLQLWFQSKQRSMRSLGNNEGCGGCGPQRASREALFSRKRIEPRVDYPFSYQGYNLKHIYHYELCSFTGRRSVFNIH